MTLRDIAQSFVTSYFDLPEEFFDTAWDFVNDNFEKISSMASSSKGIKAIEGTMAFGGTEERGAVKAILIFADGFRELPLKSDLSDFVDSIRNACSKYHAEATLTEEILKKVTSLENRIVKFLEPAERIKTVVQSQQVEEYELISLCRKSKFLTFEKAEDVRDKKGSGSKNEIFIDDERKDVFVNKKYAEEFKDLMYAMLMHFVMHAGVGGNNENLYKGVWGDAIAAEDNRDDAVQQAIKRFRKILDKYNLGKVPELSKSRYSVSKTYVMKPKPRYCILRRIEKDNEE